MKTAAALAITCTLIAGCAGSAPYVDYFDPRVPRADSFDPAEAAPLMQEGSGAIRGSAFVREPGGTVVSCAGNAVVLVPVTKYSQARMQVLYGIVDPGGPYVQRKAFMFREPPAYTAATKKTQCDEHGTFAFDRVAAGEFFAVVALPWKAGDALQNSSLMQRFTVRAGETTSLLMSP